MQKYIHQFKKGDIVHFHGARFECIEDANESFAHAPQDPKTLYRTGPSACAYCRAVCIDGQEAPGYIEHGREWTFQGNFLAGPYLVEAKHFDGNKKLKEIKMPVYFRLMMRGETRAHYDAAKSLWADSMRRNGYSPQ